MIHLNYYMTQQSWQYTNHPAYTFVFAFLHCQQSQKIESIKWFRIDQSNDMLKLVSAIFFFFFFTKWQPFKNCEKCFLFHLKCSFRSRDIQLFVFPSSPVFLLVSHCFRWWIKINLKVYDVTNCLNKNLIKHFVWYLEKEKSYDIETLSIDRVLNKKNVYGKSCRKCAPKASPRPLFNFGK